MVQSIHLLIIILFAVSFSHAQEPQINAGLKEELARIHESDQKYRRYLGRVNRDLAFRDSLIIAWDTDENNLTREIWNRQLENDSINLIRVTEIINKYGYPGKSLVGEEESTAVWYVIQHAPVEIIKKYLPIIKEAAHNNELPARLVGMMEDRMLMYQGKEQIYGTQGSRITLKSGDYLWIIWPIKDPENVNKRRKEIGFNDTIEENAERMGIDYKPFTLEEIRAMVDKLPYED